MQFAATLGRYGNGPRVHAALEELLDSEQPIAEQGYEDDFGGEEWFARVRSQHGRLR